MSDCRERPTTSLLRGAMELEGETLRWSVRYGVATQSKAKQSKRPTLSCYSFGLVHAGEMQKQRRESINRNTPAHRQHSRRRVFYLADDTPIQPAHTHHHDHTNNENNLFGVYALPRSWLQFGATASNLLGSTPATSWLPGAYRPLPGDTSLLLLTW